GDVGEKWLIGKVQQSSSQIGNGRVGIDGWPRAAGLQDRLDLRCEVKRRTILIEVERLDAETIAGNQQSFFLPIVKQNRPHPVETRERARPPFDERRKNDRRVPKVP